MKKDDKAKLNDLIDGYGLPHVLDTLATLCDNQADMLKRGDADYRIVQLWRGAARNLHRASLEAEFNG